jgi:hypothetical protein
MSHYAKVIDNEGIHRLDKHGNRHPYRWYHAIVDAVVAKWDTREWRRRQKEFERTCTRYYGDGGTIHGTQWLDVQVDIEGRVVAVWFRCQLLPYRVHAVDGAQAKDMRHAYDAMRTELHGVEVRP